MADRNPRALITEDPEDPDAHFAACSVLLDELEAGAHPCQRALLDVLRASIGAMADAYDERTARIASAVQAVQAASTAAHDALGVELGWNTTQAA